MTELNVAVDRVDNWPVHSVTDRLVDTSTPPLTELISTTEQEELLPVFIYFIYLYFCWSLRPTMLATINSMMYAMRIYTDVFHPEKNAKKFQVNITSFTAENPWIYIPVIINTQHSNKD